MGAVIPGTYSYDILCHGGVFGGSLWRERSLGESGVGCFSTPQQQYFWWIVCGGGGQFLRESSVCGCSLHDVLVDCFGDKRHFVPAVFLIDQFL